MANHRARQVINPDVEPTLYRGVINTTASSPTDTVTARVPALFDGEDFITSPLSFDERHDGHLPTRGDVCLIGIDDQGGEWLLAYEPTTT